MAGGDSGSPQSRGEHVHDGGLRSIEKSRPLYPPERDSIRDLDNSEEPGVAEHWLVNKSELTRDVETVQSRDSVSGC